MQNFNKMASREILKGIKYFVTEAMKKTTKIYDGFIVSYDVENKWNIRYNGEIHSVKNMSKTEPSVNSMVKVVVPQGNQSLAFFELPMNIDYIVEQGQSGDWYYRKWNSGVAECWAKKSFEITFSAWQNVAISQACSFGGFPIAFRAVPVCNISPSIDSTLSVMSIANSSVGTNIDSGSFNFVRPGSDVVGATFTATAAISVHGQWK